VRANAQNASSEKVYRRYIIHISSCFFLEDYVISSSDVRASKRHSYRGALRSSLKTSCPLLPFPLPRAEHYPQLGVQFRIIPKGLRPPARGCEARATLGKWVRQWPTPTGLWPGTERGSHNPGGVDRQFRSSPRVARRSLGFDPVGIRRAGPKDVGNDVPPGGAAQGGNSLKRNRAMKP